MRVLNSYVSLLVFGLIEGFDIFQPNRMYIYNFTGKVEAGARNEDASLKPTNWIIKGLFQLQRIDSTTIAGWIIPHGEVEFSPTKEGGDSPRRMSYDDHIRAPFKILTGNGAINYVALNDNEPIWISNIKRAFASSFQIQAHNFGLLKVKEGTIHGFCETEYLVTNKTTHYHIRKTVNLNTCAPHAGGIHYVRSNIPQIPCKTTTLRKIIISNDATYELMPHAVEGVYVRRVLVKGSTMVNIFEATGSAQYIVSSLEFNHMKEKPTANSLDPLTGTSLLTSLEYVSHRKDPSGGRAKPTNQQYIDQIVYLLNYLTDNLETTDTINFREPIDNHVSEIFRLLSVMDQKSMHSLFFSHIDKGTSYRQETIRNIFLEILPRIGTTASVLLTRDIILKQQVKSTTAVQLLISLPFHIDELSAQLVQDCEPFLTLGNISPDVRQAGVLAYSILIHSTYMAGKMSTDEFERYVKKFFDYFLSSVDYEQQMLYINAMANLQQGNVADYLEPIIRADYPQNTDIRFLAIISTLPIAQSRPEKSYEIYWPIFESKETPLQLRIAAFIMLLHSDPSPARLMSIHEVMAVETCPHLLQFYITTLQSLKKTTYPCYQQLKEVIGFLSRHLPKKANPRYWSTGNYLFDYIHDSGIGGMFSAMLIADDEMKNIPHIMMASIKTEALGKYTGQLSLYLKVRGITDMFYKKQLVDFASLGLSEILRNLKFSTVSDTPLHFEMILQMEGKSVLSYYLNQTSFDSLPQGELTSRLTAVLFGDTHINMQSFRWPFINKYSVPTVLGTPAEVLIETTVATTVRGNITNVLKELKRNQQIDMRYSSYSQCQSLIYNPFLNFEHQIKQEQGFLGYFPLNMELQFNMERKNIELAFALPKNTETGFALKSRLATGIYEFLLLGENSKNGSQVIFEESEADLPISVFNQEFKDLGLNFEFDIGYKGLYRNVFNPTENWFVDKNLGGFDENGHSRFIGNYILQIINIGHVSATHLGNNKYVKGVISNPEDCKLVWKLENQSTNEETEFDVYTLELGLEQYNALKVQADQLPNHKWSGMIKVRMHHSSLKAITTQVIFKRITPADEWRLCLENTYNPLIFAKKPENFNMIIYFGDMEPDSSRKCPDKSKLKISGSFNIHPGVEHIIGEMEDDAVNEKCPKKLIYFNPPILKCDKFVNVTKVTDYQLNITATQMPEFYSMWMRRLEQLYSSVTTGTKTDLGWEDQLNVKVTSPVGDRFMNLTVNGISTDLLDIANVFNSDHDVKHHTMAQMFEEYGFLHSCSVVGNTVLGYNELRANLDDYVTTESNKTCGILLAADCSRKSSFAIFVEPVAGFPLKDRFAIRYFVGETSILVSPDDRENVVVENFGVFKSKEVVKVRNRNFEAEGKDYLQFSNFYYTEENILTVEHKLFDTKIQFNMENLLQISTKFWLQSKVCGLCAHQASKVASPVYSYCFV